jgi:hypothetical protein
LNQLILVNCLTLETEMLSFATEFPIQREPDLSQLVGVVRNWILESPHTSFSPEDLAGIEVEGEWRREKDREQLHAMVASSDDEQACAVEYIKADTEQDIVWITTIVFSRDATECWVSIRISPEANHPATTLPAARKPVFVQILLGALGGAPDGELVVKREPHWLGEDDVDMAASVIGGKSTCRLPVVYLSIDFRNQQVLDANALAHDLAGMAHVLVEPSRRFSRLLQIKVDSQNVYGGAVGIYWPYAAGRRSFFVESEYDYNTQKMKRAVIEEVRTALTNRRPLTMCTWPHVQEMASKQAIKRLQDSGSKELSDYIEAFDPVLKAKEEELRGAEIEIERLGEEIQRYEHQFRLGTGFIRLRTGSEHDLYEGELVGIVRDAIQNASNNVRHDSRRQHILNAILESTPATQMAETLRNKIREVLRGYTGMDGRTKKSLEELGFSVDKDGPHWKLTFYDDDRYTYSLATSGGDSRRGGLNAASDISNLFF